jgi:hypothetical protein
LRRFILGLVAGAMIATAATAAAASMTAFNSSHASSRFTMHNGDTLVTADGRLACVYEFGTTSYGTILCGKLDRPHGYTIGINRYLVSVLDKTQFVFKHSCC